MFLNSEYGLHLFQLTTSRRGRLQSELNFHGEYHFNSRPHEEVDIRAEKSVRLSEHFNSRPHEEVDATCVTSCLCVKVFQLTTSRRGRPTA